MEVLVLSVTEVRWTKIDSEKNSDLQIDVTHCTALADDSVCGNNEVRRTCS